MDAADPWGILIENGEFTAFDVYKDLPFNNPTQVHVSPNVVGSVSFSNSAFWGPSKNIAVLNGQPQARVSFSNCIFNDWDVQKNGNFAIEAHGSVRLMVTACDFQHAGNQISIASTVQSAVIENNMVNGTVRILNNSTSRNVKIGTISASKF